MATYPTLLIPDAVSSNLTRKLFGALAINWQYLESNANPLYDGGGIFRFTIQSTRQDLYPPESTSSTCEHQRLYASDH
jgi:hypothetical protein